MEGNYMSPKCMWQWVSGGGGLVQAFGQNPGMMGTRPELSVSEWKEPRDSHSRRTLCGNCAAWSKVSEQSVAEGAGLEF